MFLVHNGLCGKLVARVSAAPGCWDQLPLLQFRSANVLGTGLFAE